jgi:hypothetical protein
MKEVSHPKTIKWKYTYVCNWTCTGLSLCTWNLEVKSPHGMLRFIVLSFVGEIHDLSSAWAFLLRPTCRSPKVGQS